MIDLGPHRVSLAAVLSLDCRDVGRDTSWEVNNNPGKRMLAWIRGESRQGEMGWSDLFRRRQNKS